MVAAAQGKPKAQAPLFYEADGEAREMSAALFQRLDKNRSGALCQDELLQARNVMLCQEDDTSQQAIANLTSLDAEFDANGDCEIDEEEWHDFVGSLYEVMGRKHFLMVARSWAAAPDCRDTEDSAKRRRSSAGDEKEKEALTAAATRIQSLQRGKKARATVKKQRTAAIQKKLASDSTSTEQKLVSVAEYWELLMLQDGRVKTSVEVIDLVQAFESCKLAGMDSRLVTYVKMYPTERAEPEDLSPGEVAHLCSMLTENPTLSVAEAREALGPIKKECRADAAAGAGNFAVAPGSVLSYRMYKALLLILAAILQIDVQYLVSQLQWLRTGRFEMPENLVLALIGHCVRKPSMLGMQGPLPERPEDALWQSLAGSEIADLDVEALSKFCLDDFVRLCYNTRIVDSSGRRGISYTTMSSLFTRTIARLPDLLKAHAEKVKRSPAGLAKGRQDYFTGRTELELLMGELYKEPGISKVYSSPLHMVLGFIESCKGGHALEEDIAEAEAAMSVVQDGSRNRRSSQGKTWK